MIARLRGEQHQRWAPWRPSPAPPLSPAEEPVAVGAELGWQPRDLEPVDPDPAPVGRGPLAWARGFLGWLLSWFLSWALFMIVASLLYVAIRWVVHEYTPQPPVLPASPHAWLNAYEAASIDNPPEVCSQLLSPRLAASYARQVHGSCRRYFGRITSSSVTVRRVLEQDDVAVLELRETLNRRDWSVVLAHRSNGWQAVDLIGY